MRFKCVLLCCILLMLCGRARHNEKSIKWKKYSYEHQEEIRDSLINFAFDAKIELPMIDKRDSIELGLRRDIVLLLFGDKYIDVSNDKLLKR